MRKIALFLTVALTAGLVASCGDDDNEEVYGYDATRFTGDAPQVVSSLPAADAVDVDTLKQIIINYDRDISIPEHVTIRVNNDWIDSGVVANGSQLIIPYELKGNTTYTVAVMKPTVRNENYVFASEYKFSFSTMLVNAFDPTRFQISDMPVNPNATPETVKLYQYLKENFGKRMLSGAMANVSWNTENAERMHQLTGKYPAINGFDFIHFHRSAPLHPEGWIDYTNTQVVEDWAAQNGIVSCMWHWQVPRNQAGENNYADYVIHPDETEFTALLATRTSSWQYAHAIRDIDIIADYLLALQAKGIAVLWRPLHEARGNYGKWNNTGKAWFWWGTSGPAPFKRLWQQMFNRFKEKGVNNVIWVWTSDGLGEVDTTDASWYPGDEYVDIIARDYYCTDRVSLYHSAFEAEFEALYEISGGKKIIALSEGDAIPSVNNVFTTGAVWSWFMPWYDSSEVKYIDSDLNTAAFLKELFDSPYVVTRDQVPDLR